MKTTMNLTYLPNGETGRKTIQNVTGIRPEVDYLVTLDSGHEVRLSNPTDLRTAVVEVDDTPVDPDADFDENAPQSYDIDITLSASATLRMSYAQAATYATEAGLDPRDTSGEDVDDWERKAEFIERIAREAAEGLEGQSLDIDIDSPVQYDTGDFEVTYGSLDSVSI